MRLHFLIFVALRGTPFAALPYASKVTGLLEDLEMGTPRSAASVSGSSLLESIAQLDARPGSLRADDRTTATGPAGQGSPN